MYILYIYCIVYIYVYIYIYTKIYQTQTHTHRYIYISVGVCLCLIYHDYIDYGLQDVLVAAIVGSITDIKEWKLYVSYFMCLASVTNFHIAINRRIYDVIGFVLHAIV